MCYISTNLKRFGAICLTVALLTAGCKRETVIVTGTVSGAGSDEYLVLQEIKPGILEPLDSVIPDPQGNFSFRTETPRPSFYMISMGRDNFMTLLLSPGEKVTVKALRDSLSLPYYLTGSEG